MHSTSSAQRLVRLASLAMLAVQGAACASAGVAASHPPRSTVRVEPAPAAQVGPPTGVVGAANEPAAPPPAPRLEGTAPTLTAAPEPRIRVLDVPAGTPVARAVMQVGSQLGLSVTVDPAVQGTVSASLRNVTVDQALTELLAHAGATYQLQGSVLRVVPVRMESRTFQLDYVALQRVGTMSTVVQRRLANVNNGGIAQLGTAAGLASPLGGVNYGGVGGDVLSAESVADIWQEIRTSLTGILQAGQPAQHNAAPVTDQSAVNASTQSLGGMFTSGAASVSFPDGSSLVISPMSGLINITAMPDKLAAAERFINEFQASVLRQVLIEAKIVEVTLTDSFQYGIDWSLVTSAAKGKFGVTLRSDASVQTTGNAGNINFTFHGGSTQINAVINALATQGNVNVLSNEKTTALNNQRAIFDVSTDEVFFSVTRTPLFGASGGVVTTQSSIIPQQISVGVVLDVLPQISADNVLTMSIRPAVTNIDHIETISLPDGTSASAPAITRREGDTIARLRGGETMIIGGLVQSRKDRTVSGIPLLKDIPLIGKAFQHIDDTETRSELVVFLTPTIISGQPAAGR